MGRENINDYPIVIQSSIALLQERFRQLQRMKEMREEREQLLRKQEKAEAPAKHCSPSGLSLSYEPPSRLFFHFLPVSTSPPQPPLSHWSAPASHNKYCSTGAAPSTTCQCVEAQVFASLFTTVTETPNSMHVSMNKFQVSDGDYEVDHDVDTSLHL